ncbi:hypothetical protein BFL38_10840 [Brachyspira hampsonii]|uniref:Lipoprotein n=1 Tax=Brachyspira hampsonii TaxID=1287055 RepID=A0A1E5NIK4_9SPIR|nr:hypothetical protein [Brachyspira hampsonii]OEJ15946.1 hypothetical protein BFL38_10840 [Brachyspira hampsonii]
MYKKIILLLIALFLFSCSSPYGSSGSTKFKSRKGIYQNEAQNVAVEITDKDSNNLTVKVTGNTPIDETLTLNSESAGTYFTVKSAKYTGYVYDMNFGNSLNTIFITIKDGQNNNVVFNEKLSKQ